MKLLDPAISVVVAGIPVQLQLSDFNRVRWTIAALRLNPRILQRSITEATTIVTVIDSLVLLKRAEERSPAPVPVGANIVLWDGLNSLAELWAAQREISGRTDIHYLYVGCHFEVEKGFGRNSAPLFPKSFPRSSPIVRTDVIVPRWVDASGWLRTRLRPFKNARLAPVLHRRLNRGRQAVFCGLVRPRVSVLNDFFRFTTLTEVRRSLQLLVDVDWQFVPLAGESLLRSAYDSMRSAEPRTPLEFAALYAAVNLLHRLLTVSRLAARTDRLLINEFGVHSHLDPYDTAAYRHNLFLDFGSSRGPDAVYPRTVDLWINSKRVKPMRLIGPLQSLATFLRNIDSTGFWQICTVHAEEVLRELALLDMSSEEVCK